MEDMSPQQALCKALILAFHASTDSKRADAIDLAEDIAKRLTNEQVAVCKRAVQDHLNVETDSDESDSEDNCDESDSEDDSDESDSDSDSDLSEGPPTKRVKQEISGSSVVL